MAVLHLNFGPDWTVHLNTLWLLFALCTGSLCYWWGWIWIHSTESERERERDGNSPGFTSHGPSVLLLTVGCESADSPDEGDCSTPLTNVLLRFPPRRLTPASAQSHPHTHTHNWKPSLLFVSLRWISPPLSHIMMYQNQKFYGKCIMRSVC